LSHSTCAVQTAASVTRLLYHCQEHLESQAIKPDKRTMDKRMLQQQQQQPAMVAAALAHALHLPSRWAASHAFRTPLVKSYALYTNSQTLPARQWNIRRRKLETHANPPARSILRFLDSTSARCWHRIMRGMVNGNSPARTLKKRHLASSLPRSGWRGVSKSCACRGWRTQTVPACSSCCFPCSSMTLSNAPVESVPRMIPKEANTSISTRSK